MTLTVYELLRYPLAPSRFETGLRRFPDKPFSGLVRVFAPGILLLSRFFGCFHAGLMECVRVAAGIPLFLPTLRANNV
jgi:hypothetical protein